MQLIIIILIFLCSTLANASTYYIDYTTGNDAAAGTKVAPWKYCPGMPHFAGVYSHDGTNGDTFVFKGGETWPLELGHETILTVANSGVSAGKEDTYTRDVTWYTGGSWSYPVFDGGTPEIAPGTINGISSTGKSHLIFEYIKIINIGNGPAGTGGGTSTTSLTIANGTSKTFTTQSGLDYVSGGLASRVRATSDANAANYMEGIVTSYSSTTLIILIDTIGGSGTLADWSFTMVGDGGGKAMFFAGGSNVTTRYMYLSANCDIAWQYSGSSTTSGIYLHNNTIRQFGRVSLDAGDERISDILLHDNTLEGGWDYTPSGAYHTNGFIIGGDGVADYPISGMKIYNNKFWGDWRLGATALIYLTGSTGKKASTGTLIYNNLMIPSNATIAITGGWIQGIMAWKDTANLGIYNNVIDLSASAATRRPAFGIVLQSPGTTTVIKNNIIRGFEDAIAWSDWTGVTVDNNTFYDNTHIIWDVNASNRVNTCLEAQALGWQTSDTTCAYTVVDPKFTTAVTLADHDGGGYGISNGDWTLQSSSPAIGTGAVLNATFTTDYNGATRGATWDIGAYEYTAGATGTTLGSGGSLSIGAGGTITFGP